MSAFVGRSEEQDRFRRVLAEVAGKADGGPDEGYVVLVRGYGGIGKTSLLERYREIATGRLPEDRLNRDLFLVATVDWERDRRLHPEDYAAFAGPPIWRTLERIRAALDIALAEGPAWPARRGRAAFAGFRRQVAATPDLEERARQLGISRTLGHRPVTPEQMATTTKLATTLAAAAGVQPAMTKTVDNVAAAATKAVSAVRDGRPEQLDMPTYRALVDEVGAVVAAFADSMRALARRRRVVVLLDTCELLGESGDWLREVMLRCGRQVLWVVGMRLEPESQAAGESESARYQRDLDDQRLRDITLTRFDDRTVSSYLAERLGDLLPDDLDTGKIIELTHGVPLAVALMSDMLTDRLEQEQPIADLYQEVSGGGEISTIVKDMALRYLVHAQRAESELSKDLPLLFGLALVYSDSETTRPWLDLDERAHDAIGRDPALLAALWDIPIDQVSLVKTRLARRHDFVHSRDGSLHRDVRDAVRRYLLDPAQRVGVAKINQRAVDHLVERLTALGHQSIDDQLTDETWRTSVAALLWHTCWVEPRDGVTLLRHLFPVTTVLHPQFTTALLNIAAFFMPCCASADQRLLAQLNTVARIRGVSRDPQLQAAVHTLTPSQGSDRPVLAASPAPYLELLRAQHADRLGLALPEQAAALHRAAAGIRPDRGATATALGHIARQLAWAVDKPTSAPAQVQQSLLEGLHLAVRYLPDDAIAHNNLGWILNELERYEQAEAAYREAIRLDPRYAYAYNGLGSTLFWLGRYEQAEAACREAIRFDPYYDHAYNGLGNTLFYLGRYEQAETAFREAIRLDPDYSIAHNNLGHALLYLGRHAEAETVYREAIRLDPDYSIAHNNLGSVLLNLRANLADAAQALDEAVRLDPHSVSAQRNRGWLHLINGDVTAARACLMRASALAEGGEPKAELLLGVLDRTIDANTADTHLSAALTAVQRPATPRIYRSPFGLAESRALALAGLGQPEEAVEVLRAAVRTRTPADLFARPLYDLLTIPQPVAGLNELLDIWREIIAADPAAAGPWGGPAPS